MQGSPNCWPWSNNSRGWPAEKKRRARHGEIFTLRFWVMMCFLQIVMGRAYLNEQPRGSDMYTESFVAKLADNGLVCINLSQISALMELR